MLSLTTTALRIGFARLALGLAAAFAGLAPAHAQAPAKPLKPVTIALGTQVVNVTYPWLTLPIALGYWKEEGYDVKVVTVGGSLQGIQQMVAGGVEFAQVNSTGLIQANTDNNVAVRGLMGTGVIDWGIGVTQDGPIKSVTDLKGKKIGIFSLGTGGVPLLKGYLRSNGIDPDKDVQIIATGAGAPALEALKSDRVQALMFWGSALTGFQNAGTPLRVLYAPAWRALPDFTFATMQKTIDADPAMVEAISRGAAKATLFAWTNPDCARRIHWKSFPSTKPTGADEATLAKWDLALLNTQLDTMKAAHTMNGGKLIGAMDPAAYGRMQDFMQGEGLIKRTVPVESMLYLKPGFVEAINRFDHQAVIDAAKACKAG
ncbi:ABC transporter substrate-binding protein [Pseudacidovorax sp. RU35E]|uniref:ABC transporter substrate-binding protein n=1 Tax=Pseudacidovorax sp. RU35E TaxID=1907403 RepID=UPI000954D2E4|nr:ABC transporter substrate-binding protein [Pseudacidovorax sp. RU35E]SIR56742.1 NitT/TauT family transport system substrate-binding protein [Pseudacidovorax sp. RU35E]